MLERVSRALNRLRCRWIERGTVMGEPVEVEGASTESLRSLRPVPSESTTDLADLADLAERLAAALRTVRGYVPHHIWWWQDGPAEALLAYQASEGT